MRPVKIVNDAFLYADTDKLDHYAWAHMDGYPDYGFFFSGDTGRIRSLCQQRKDLRANGVRTFFQWFRSGYGFTIDPKTPGFYDKVGDYLDLLAEYELYCNLVSGDYQVNNIDQYDHLMKLMAAIGDRPAFLSGCNENDANGADPAAITRALSQHPANILVSIGSSLGGGACPLPMPNVSGQFAEQHTRRDPLPAMYADTAAILYQQVGYPGYPGVGMIPVPITEPIGFAEVSIPGRRTADTNVAFKIARYSSANNNTTCHSDAGETGQLLTGNQLACAEAFFTGIF